MPSSINKYLIYIAKQTIVFLSSSAVEHCREETDDGERG